MSDRDVRLLLLVVAAGVVTYALRAAPFVLFGHKRFTGNEAVFRVLTYAAYAVIGGLIGESVARRGSSSDSGTRDLLVKLAAVAFTFLLSLRLKRKLPALVLGLVFFLGLRLLT